MHDMCMLETQSRMWMFSMLILQCCIPRPVLICPMASILHVMARDESFSTLRLLVLKGLSVACVLLNLP